MRSAILLETCACGLHAVTEIHLISVHAIGCVAAGSRTWCMHFDTGPLAAANVGISQAL